jgi:hypothetical protein
MMEGHNAPSTNNTERFVHHQKIWASGLLIQMSALLL